MARFIVPKPRHFAHIAAYYYHRLLYCRTYDEQKEFLPLWEKYRRYVEPPVLRVGRLAKDFQGTLYDDGETT